MNGILNNKLFQATALCGFTYATYIMKKYYYPDRKIRKKLFKEKKVLYRIAFNTKADLEIKLCFTLFCREKLFLYYDFEIQSILVNSNPIQISEDNLEIKEAQLDTNLVIGDNEIIFIVPKEKIKGSIITLPRISKMDNDKDQEIFDYPFVLLPQEGERILLQKYLYSKSQYKDFKIKIEKNENNVNIFSTVDDKESCNNLYEVLSDCKKFLEDYFKIRYPYKGFSLIFSYSDASKFFKIYYDTVVLPSSLLEYLDQVSKAFLFFIVVNSFITSFLLITQDSFKKNVYSSISDKAVALYLTDLFFKGNEQKYKNELLYMEIIKQKVISFANSPDNYSLNALLANSINGIKDEKVYYSFGLFLIYLSSWNKDEVDKCIKKILVSSKPLLSLIKKIDEDLITSFLNESKVPIYTSAPTINSISIYSKHHLPYKLSFGLVFNSLEEIKQFDDVIMKSCYDIQNTHEKNLQPPKLIFIDINSISLSLQFYNKNELCFLKQNIAKIVSALLNKNNKLILAIIRNLFWMTIKYQLEKNDFVNICMDILKSEVILDDIILWNILSYLVYTLSHDFVGYLEKRKEIDIFNFIIDTILIKYKTMTDMIVNVLIDLSENHLCILKLKEKIRDGIEPIYSKLKPQTQERFIEKMNIYNNYFVDDKTIKIYFNNFPFYGEGLEYYKSLHEKIFHHRKISNGVGSIKTAKRLCKLASNIFTIDNKKNFVVLYFIFKDITMITNQFNQKKN